MVTYTSPKDTDDPLADNEIQDDNEAGSSCHKSQSLSSQRGGGDIADDLHSYASASPHPTSNAGRLTVAIQDIHPKDIEKATWDKVLLGEYFFLSSYPPTPLNNIPSHTKNRCKAFPSGRYCHFCTRGRTFPRVQG